MTPSTPPTAVCSQCCKRFRRASERGRPPRFCSNACRNAARRIPKDDQPAGNAQDDIAVYQAVGHVSAKLARVRRAARAVGSQRTPLGVLEEVAALHRELDVLTALAVQQVRGRGGRWDAIAAVLGTSPPTARARWSPEKINRLLTRRRHNTPGRARRRTNPAPATPPGPDMPDDEKPTVPAGEPAAQLSVALSFLQRSSAQSLRRLAKTTGISPSHLCRLLTGERIPSWPVAEQLTQACGADPAQIRPLWERAHGLTPARPFFPTSPGAAQAAAADLSAALQGLHLASARPEPAAIARRTDGAITEHQIAALLNGHEPLPRWEVLRSCVQALRGHPGAVRPLWERLQVAHDPTWNPDTTTPRTP